MQEDHEGEKAVVFHEKSTVSVPFRNFSASGRKEVITEEDAYYSLANKKAMVEDAHSFLPTLESIRLIGVVSKNEFDWFKMELEKEKVKLEIDSPYLIIVD